MKSALGPQILCWIFESDKQDKYLSDLRFLVINPYERKRTNTINLYKVNYKRKLWHLEEYTRSQSQGY